MFICVQKKEGARKKKNMLATSPTFLVRSDMLIEQQKFAGAQAVLSIFLNTTGNLHDFDSEPFEAKIHRFFQACVHQSEPFKDGARNQFHVLQNSRLFVSKMHIPPSPCKTCGLVVTCDNTRLHYDLDFYINTLRKIMNSANQEGEKIYKVKSKHTIVHSQKSIAKRARTILKMQEIPNLRPNTNNRLNREFDRMVDLSNNNGVATVAISQATTSTTTTISRGWFAPKNAWVSKNQTCPTLEASDMVMYGRYIVNTKNAWRGLWESTFEDRALAYASKYNNFFVTNPAHKTTLSMIKKQPTNTTTTTTTATNTNAKIYITVDDRFSDIVCFLCGESFQIVKLPLDDVHQRICIPHDKDEQDNSIDDSYVQDDDYFLKDAIYLSNKKKQPIHKGCA